MLVKIRVYDRMKYHADAEQVAEARYEIERFEILNGEQINIESFGGDVDEHDEYLVLYLSNGESSTFRNSYVDLFIEHNEPNGTTDKEVDEMAQNILFMEKRGCDFFHGEHINSDIGNYRICTASYIKLADGRQMFFEFCRSDRYQFRNVNKRTGAPLKKPVYELVMKDACALNTCYDGGDGMSYRDLDMEHSFHSSPVPYTLKTVLEFINSVSAKQYSAIRFV